MKTKVPTTIKFMSKRWTVKFKKIKKEFGLCDHRKLRISLMEDQPEEHMLDTLMHELVHALDYEMGIGLKEKQVAKLGTGLAHLLCENPKLRSLFE